MKVSTSALKRATSVWARPCEPPVYLEDRTLCDVRRRSGRRSEGHDLVVAPVDDEGRPVDRLEVARLGDLREVVHAIKLPLDAAAEALEAKARAKTFVEGAPSRLKP